MPRKRKIPRNNQENEAPVVSEQPKEDGPKNQKFASFIVSAQKNDAHHDKLIKEFQNEYSKWEHSKFLEELLATLRVLLIQDRANEHTARMLKFCAKFVATYNTDDNHPLVSDVFKWCLKTLSPDKNVRLGLCEFINLLLQSLGEEAVLDDSICDEILKYMTHAINDQSNPVREQAVYALQRLQMPEEPNDPVVKLFLFHMASDSAPRVRQAIITSILRNINTIPHIVERMWDADDKVRRHVILEMSSLPVRSLKIAVRLTLLEQGLNDHYESVRKAVTNVLLPCWVTGYNNDYIALVEALKLDTNDKEMQRFRKCALQALEHIFKKSSMEKIVTTLGFAAPEPRRPSDDDDDEDEEEMGNPSFTTNTFPKCVPFADLTNEVAVYWEAAVNFLQNEDELNAIQPELTIFCQYVEKYCESIHFENDKWQQMKNQHVLLNLLEIVAMYDLGDEVGRKNLKKLLWTLLTKYDLNEMNISVIVRILEQVYPFVEERLTIMVDAINEILQLGDSSAANGTLNTEMEATLLKTANVELRLKVSELKVKMMDLKEQEVNCVQRKDYANAQKATEEWNQCNEEYIQLIQPLLANITDTTGGSSSIVTNITLKPPQKITTETIEKCLEIIYYTIASKNTASITPAVVNLYSQFISRHMDSKQSVVRDWAFKCATTFSMLYSMLAKEVAQKLCEQFSKNTNVRIWATSIECLFELVDRYTLDFFIPSPSEDDVSTTNKTAGKMTKSRQLYSSSCLDNERDSPQNVIDVIGQLSQLLDNCEHSSIVQALVIGFCRFVIHGHYTEPSIVMRLLLYFFNPATEPAINQLLGIFFDTLTREKKQEYLQPALLPALFVIYEAPMDSPLQEIKPTAIIDFVIDVTKPEYCSAGLNIHNTIAMSFIKCMQENVTQRDLLKVLSRGLLSLEISDDPTFRQDLKKCCDELLKVTGLNEKVMRNISQVKDILDGKQPPSVTFSSTRITSNDQRNDFDDDEDSEDEAAAEVTELKKLTEDPEEPANANSVISNENETEVTVKSTEEILIAATPSPQRQSEVEQEDIRLPETQKTPSQSSPASKIESSQISSDVSTIEASFDEAAATSRNRRRLAKNNPTSAKRLPEARTPTTRAKLTKLDSGPQKKGTKARKDQGLLPKSSVGSPSRRAKDPNYRAKYLEEKGLVSPQRSSNKNKDPKGKQPEQKNSPKKKIPESPQPGPSSKPDPKEQPSPRTTRNMTKDKQKNPPKTVSERVSPRKASKQPEAEEKRQALRKKPDVTDAEKSGNAKKRPSSQKPDAKSSTSRATSSQSSVASSYSLRTTTSLSQSSSTSSVSSGPSRPKRQARNTRARK